MIQFFPKLKLRLFLVCGGYLALSILLILLRPGLNLFVFIPATLIALLILFASQYMSIVNAHNKLLNQLYNQLDVEGFLRSYEPLLKLDIRKPNLYLIVRLHLSNAYCALGRFDEAARLLESAEFKEGKNPEQTLINRFALVSNLCYFAEQQNDLPNAQRLLDQLLDYRKQLDEIQLKKPEKKRMVFNTDLNEQCMKLLKTGTADIDVLRTQVQKNNSQILHQITTSLWIARAELGNNNRKEAEKILRKIIKLAPDLYPGQLAQQILNGLPAASDEETASES